MAISSIWIVSETKDESLVNLVVTHPRANPRPLHLRLKGLDPAARYRLERLEVFEAYLPEPPEPLPEVFSGAALLYAGLTLPRMMGDYPGVQIHLKRVED